ncbi:MAG: right-handed parallel beta-helix repeat-containing protein, partial [Candidatus Woesearchaeota archaeon]
MNRKLASLLMVAVFAMMAFAVLHGSRSPTGFAVDYETIDNLAPVWTANITTFVIGQGAELVLNLDNYFADPEGLPLTYIATQTENMNVVLEDSILSITPEPAFVGERIVSIMASDGLSVTTKRIRVEVIAAQAEQPRMPTINETLPEPIVNETMPERVVNETIIVPEAHEARTVALNAAVNDESGRVVGKKVSDEPDYETFFTFVGKENGRFVVRFYHNSSSALPVWVEGNVSAEISSQNAEPLEEVEVSVPLRADGSIPLFRLHIGEESEVFEFGTPEVGVQDGGHIAATCTSCAECTTCAATPGNTCTLTNSITSTGTCITVGADNVVIDCANNIITYGTGGASNAHGIASMNRIGLVIENCTIKDTHSSGNYGYAINLTNTTYSRIMYNNLIANGSSYTRALYLYKNASFNTIANNNITAISTTFGTYNYAVYLYLDAHNNIIENNSIFVYGNAGYNTALYLQDRIENNTISNNTISGTGTGNAYNKGIVLEGPAKNNSISYNNITTNAPPYSANHGVTISTGVTGTVIAGNTISTNGSANAYGVYLSSYVQNCTVANNTIVTKGSSSGNYGILVDTSSRNITIDNNTITTYGSYNNDGINLGSGSHNSIITNNVINANGTTYQNRGILVVTSNNLTITGNIVRTKGTYENHGLFLSTTSAYAKVFNNSIIANGSTTYNYGIYVYSSSDNNLIIDNNVTTSGVDSYGIVIENSQNNSLSGNLVNITGNNDGLHIYGTAPTHFLHEITTTNTINGTPIYYYGGLGNSPACPNNQVLDNPDALHIDFISCNNITLTNYNANEPVTLFNVTNSTIHSSVFSRSRYGLKILFGSSGILISNNTINATNTTYSYQYGIWILGAGNNTITNNNISVAGSSNYNYAVLLQNDANDNNFTDNTIIATGAQYTYGVYTEASARNIFTNNLIRSIGSSSENRGVYLYSGAAFNLINNNTITANGSSISYGVYAYSYAQNNTISNNTIITDTTSSHNSYAMLIDSYSSFNNITNNNIKAIGWGSSDHGIKLGSYTSRTLIANNNISTYTGADNDGIYMYSYIYNTTIVNNTIVTSGSGGGNDGIYAGSTIIDTIIENNIINATGGTNGNRGVYLSSTANLNIVRNNIISTNGTYENFGVYLSSTANTNRIINNSVITKGTSYSNHGIYVSSGSYNTIENNTIIANGTITNFGTYLSSASYNNVSGNNITTIGTDSYGLYLSNSPNNRLAYNNITTQAMGLVVGGSDTSHFITNSIAANNYKNNSLIYYYGGAGDSPPCPNNQVIDGSDGAHIDLLQCKNVTLKNVALYEFITLVNVFNSTITNNNITGIHGIIALFRNTGNNLSFNNILVTNTIYSDRYGVLVAYDSHKNTVSNNNITTRINNQYGLGVYVLNSNEVNVTNNDISTNGTSYNYGIDVNNGTNCFVANNFIKPAGTGGSNFGVYLVSGTTGTTVSNNTILTYGTNYNYGINLHSYTQNNTISNNTIRTNGTSTENVGIIIQSYSHFNNITNNDIVTGPYGQSNNYGIELVSVIYKTLIANNVISTNGGSNAHGVYFYGTNINNNTLNNNTISTKGSSSGNYGVYVYYTVYYNIIENNTISTYGTSDNYGVAVVSTVYNNTVANNRIITNGSSSNNYGIYLASTGIDNKINNNTIITDGTINNHAIFLSSVGKNFVSNNNLSAKGGNAYAIYLASTTGSWINDTTITLLPGVANWTYSDSSSRNNFTNTTFAMPAGSINIIPRIQINTSTAILQKDLNISYNRARINSTALPYFNTSGIITLTGLAISDIVKPIVDYEDDGTYVLCPESQCTVLSYENGVLVYNVTRFTSYSAQLSSISGINLTKTDSPDPAYINQNLTYQINVTSSGNETAYNVTVNETYPEQVIYVSSQPDPQPGTNFSWFLGDMENGTSILINITVLVKDIADGTIINNTVNATFQNSTSNYRTTSITESTLILAPPPVIEKVDLNSTNPLTNDTNQNLIAYPIYSYLPAMFVKNITQWYVNNTPYEIINMPFETGSNSTFTRNYAPYTNGTVINAVYNNSNGYDRNGAYYFGGSARIRILPNITLGNNFTILMWINSSSTGAWSTLVGESSSKSFYYSGDVKKLNYYYSSASHLSNTPIERYEWHHVGIVNKGGAVTFYLDGKPDGTIASGAPAITVVGIGGHDGGEYYSGWIDEVRIYNRSLSTEEVYQIFINTTNKIISKELRTGDVWSVAVTPITSRFEGNTVLSNNVTILPVYYVLNVSFIPPTPANNTQTPNRSVIINASIVSEAGLNEFKYNWNGTNFSVYNDSLVLMFNFDNRSALGESDTKVVDVSVYGNNGSLGGGVSAQAPVWTASGRFGGAYYFDGVNDHISVPYIPAYNITSSYTISAWVKIPLSFATSGIILARTQKSPYHHQLVMSTSTDGAKLRCFHYDSTWPNYPTSASIRTGDWVFVACTYDSTTKTMTEYVNGLKDTQFNEQTDPLGDTIVPLQIGGDVEENNYYLNGTIDEVRIWNRSLSAQEVYELYASNLMKYNPTQWYFIVNQSKNATTDLDYGTYTYSACAKDINDQQNCTETRFLEIIQEAGAVYNFSNLSVIKTDNVDPANVSQNLTYVINVTTTGNGTSYNITVNDTYPEQVIYLTSQPSPVAGTNNTWILGNITNGTTILVNITVLVRNVSNGVVINNTVNVTFQNETGVLFNYFDEENTTVIVPPEVTNITSCDVEISQNAFLGEDLYCNGTAINITSSNLVLNCTNKLLAGNGSGSIGIKIYKGLSNITIINCYIANFSIGIDADPSELLIENTTLENSTIGLEVFNTTYSTIRNNTFINNTIALLINISENNNFTNNTFINNSISLFIIDSLNNTFNQTLAPEFVIIDNSSDSGARINYSQQINLTQDTNLASIISLVNNKVFVNSSIASFLNVSAELTLRSVSFDDPKPVVDYEDDGTYEDCPPSQCSEISYSGGVFVFNTTHFTTYKAEEMPLPPVLNFSNISVTKTENYDPVNLSSLLNYTITVTSNGNGTAWNVIVNDTYPAQVIYQSAQPTPEAGTNNTWLLGNLTNGTSIAINVSVFVGNVTHNTVINNTVNVTFQNDTGALFSVAVIENTTVQSIVSRNNCGIIYYSSILSQNIASNDTCITFGSDNIFLECNGYSIIYGNTGGNDTYGINITNKANTVVRNCVIRRNSSIGLRNYGIALLNSSGGMIRNVTVITNGTSENTGIYAGGLYTARTELVSNMGSVYNEPYCTNSTAVNYCKVCFTTPGVDCAFVGQGGCTDGSNVKWDDVLSFNTTTQPTGGTITVIGGEGVHCYLNNNHILEIGTNNNCGTPKTETITADKFVIGQNNLTCSVQGWGTDEDNGFKLSAFSYTTNISQEIGTSSGITIVNSTIIAAGGNYSYGVYIDANNSYVANNRINTTGTMAGHGVFLDSGSTGTIVQNNIISAKTSGSDAIHIIESVNNKLYNNTILYATKADVYLEDSLNNIINETYLPVPPSSLYIEENDGSINFTEPINLSNTTNLTKVITVSFNYTFINSTDSAGQQLNKSAILQFYALPFSGTQAVVDPEDDNIWDICLPPRCNNQSYNSSSKIFKMNVSSFTAYATAELSECGDLDLDYGYAQQTYTLMNNVSATGTCFNIIAENITLDCRGYGIYYDSWNYNNVYGINATNVKNINIQNCTIIQNSATGQYSHAISITNSTNNTIINTIIRTNGTNSDGIRLNNTINTTIQKIVITVAGSALSTTDSNNIILNCTENTTQYGSSGNSPGINSINSNNILIDHCPITQKGTGTTIGIYLDNTTSFDFREANITTSGTNSHAISINNSQNVRITNRTITATASILRVINSQ